MLRRKLLPFMMGSTEESETSQDPQGRILSSPRYSVRIVWSARWCSPIGGTSRGGDVSLTWGISMNVSRMDTSQILNSLLPENIEEPGHRVG